MNKKRLVQVLVVLFAILAGGFGYKYFFASELIENKSSKKESKEPAKELDYDVVYVEDAYDKYLEQQKIDGDNLDLNDYLKDEYSEKTARNLEMGNMPSTQLTRTDNKLVLDALKLADDEKHENYLPSNAQAFNFDTSNILYDKKLIKEVNKSVDLVYSDFAFADADYTTTEKWYSISDFKIGDIRVSSSKLSDEAFEGLKKVGHIDENSRKEVEKGYDDKNTGVYVRYIVKASEDMSATEFMKARNIKFEMNNNESMAKPENVKGRANNSVDLDAIFHEGNYKNKDVLDSQLFYVTQFIPKAELKDINNSLRIGATEVKLKKSSKDEVFFLSSVYDE